MHEMSTLPRRNINDRGGLSALPLQSKRILRGARRRIFAAACYRVNRKLGVKTVAFFILYSIVVTVIYMLLPSAAQSLFDYIYHVGFIGCAVLTFVYRKKIPDF